MMAMLSALACLAACEAEHSSTCSPSNCTGCCADDDTCVEGAADTECGTAGAACRSCIPVGFKCFDGTCVDPAYCGAYTCPDGCCLDNVCQAGTDLHACGIEGGACIDCGPDLSCVDHDCR
jgi:hypothetical protein